MERGISLHSLGSAQSGLFAGITARIRGLLSLLRQGAAVRAQASANTEQRAERYLQDYGNAILRMAYSYVHNRGDAEDILQDTLIRVLMAAPQFENSRHEKAYLLRAAANIAKNHIQYRRRRETDALQEDLAAEGREDLSFVWEAVKQLPPRAREVLHLFYEEGFPCREIADILGRKEVTVRSDLKRAKEQLKTILKEEYDFG